MKIRDIAEQALARADKATPGPWGVDEGHLADSPKTRVMVETMASATLADGYAVASCGPPENADSRPDAEFIAHARMDLPALARFVLRVTAPDLWAEIAHIIETTAEVDYTDPERPPMLDNAQDIADEIAERLLGEGEK